MKMDEHLIHLFVETWNTLTGEPINYSGTELTRGTINHGWCYQFAPVLQKIYGGELVSPGYWHAWVRIDGVDYDSDGMGGNHRLKTHPMYKAGQKMSRCEFCKTWDKIGNSGKVRWDVIEATVQRYYEDTKVA